MSSPGQDGAMGQIRVMFQISAGMTCLTDSEAKLVLLKLQSGNYILNILTNRVPGMLIPYN